MKNVSPWIHQLDKERPTDTLKEDLETDVAIVGGGIAGVSTAFFILKNTLLEVVLLEGGRIGHGATGHNAGQLTSYFARSFASLVKEFGIDRTATAARNIEEDAWGLLDKMYTEAGLDIPLSRFVGHLGLSNHAHLLSFLEDNRLRVEAGLEPKEILVSEHLDLPQEFERYKGLYHKVPHERVLKRLETEKKDFIGCLSEQKGCLNSALFTERVAEYLLETYDKRFKVFEHAHVGKVVLHRGEGLLDVGTNTVKCGRVVLATNGFDTLNIFNKSGLDIDTRFHHSVEAVVGYMSGYLEKLDKPPIAISYFTDPDASRADPYFYLTRRPFKKNGGYNLISVGGPELDLENRKEYEREHEYPESAKEEIDAFVRSVYDGDLAKTINYIFTWHGLMGYTPNRLRLVGLEPKNPVLLYNLGCNGVGILPSIFGAERTSLLLRGDKLLPSIFDPRVD